ncbi:MAG: hypothetical protein JNM91_13845, partial [Flavobacteriales bacterium]|nr:hypothetical protein [Flavobacteriales bacterium]
AGKQLGRNAPGRSRAYFELSSTLNERPVEVLECFYNAQLNGPRLVDLRLKQGRIGIAAADDRFFVSLGTTKAISLFDPSADNPHFPVSALAMRSFKKLRQRFRVELLSAGEGPEGVDHLRLTPRDTSTAAFTQDLWLEHSTDRVRAISSSCEDCGRHPFRALWSDHTIQRVDLRIRQTLDTRNTPPVLEHVELDYALAYRNTERDEQVRTHAVIHCFDPGGAFILPFFTYDHAQDDYRKITFQPYDSSFWATAPTLVRTPQQEEALAFLARTGVLTGSTAPAEIRTQRFFESNYAWWSPTKRISLRALAQDSASSATPDIRTKGLSAPISQVDLKAQLYLDVDTSDGRARCFSATVFDGFNSYYHLEPEPTTPAVINLFFDLCEVQRRALDEALQVPGLTVDDIRRRHAEATSTMERTTYRFLSEVRLGKDRPALERWNAQVKEALGIDNLVLFGL